MKMKTILLVEDDPNDVFFLQKAMNKAGVMNPIQIATDGRQAIDYLRGVGTFADREPCLVLLDLKLPYVMGLDVLKWIREQPGTSVPVIILSASPNENDIAAAYRLGANGYLVKPSKANQLVDIAKTIKDCWLREESSSESPGETVAGHLSLPPFGHPLMGTDVEGVPDGRATASHGSSRAEQSDWWRAV